ncbi:MAG: hypothetical protein ACRDQF_15525, partial [Thermocrispum sp.]
QWVCSAQFLPGRPQPLQRHGYTMAHRGEPTWCGLRRRSMWLELMIVAMAVVFVVRLTMALRHR